MEKKRNLLCKCSFCGSAYRGFQVQVEPNTICNMLQNAIEKVFLIRYDIKGCSRTDSKVHAKEFYFNFITEKPEKLYKTENIPKALNTYLPSDIVVLDCKEVEKDFHSRYFCLGKEYIYIIKNTKNKDPFDYDRVLYYNRPFNEKLVNQAAQLFVGEHDFSAFCSKYCDIENRVRIIYSFTVEREEENIIFKVRGNGFLYNMVRIMVGTLIKINEGAMQQEDIPLIIKSQKRKNAGVTVKPEGLYLNKVFYDKKDLMDF